VAVGAAGLMVALTPVLSSREGGRSSC
jgi:hypothetical protein